MSMANSSINLFFLWKIWRVMEKLSFVFSNFNILKLRECTCFCLHLWERGRPRQAMSLASLNSDRWPLWKEEDCECCWECVWVIHGSIGHFQSGLCIFCFLHTHERAKMYLSVDLGQIQLTNNLLLLYLTPRLTMAHPFLNQTSLMLVM